ncbi:MAG TPA: LamG domain-containing protein, partial [Cytophagales bacterium]|nr:LamG domain-containing protein [Cytophagales bacterium]
MKNLIIKLMFSVTGFTSLVAQSIPSYLPSDALVGWWPFNGNANDESGFQNHGVVTGAITTADRFGNPHKAYGFDGAIGQNIIVPNSASLNIVGTEISISYWVYSENPAYDSLFKGVSKGGWVSGAGYELIFRNNYNGDKGVYQFSIPNNLNTNLVLMPNVNSNIGKWVHLAGTFKNGLAKAYLDGVLVTTTTLNNITTLKPTLADLYFGTRHPSNGVVGQLKGKLDDIAIWKRELTAAEVKTIYEGCVVDIDANATSTAIKKNSEVDIKLNFENTTATFQWQADLGMGFQNLRDTNQFMGTLTPTLSLKNVQLKNHLQTFRALVKYGVCTVYSKPFTVVLHDTCIIEKSISVTDTL